MIAEALKYLSEQARTSAKPERILAEDPHVARFVVGGVIHRVDLEPTPRRHAPGSLADVIALANRFAADEVDGATPVVWYDADRVVLVIDDAGHRVETATLALEHSDVWKTLVRLRDQKPWFEPKKFVRLLRIDLARTLEPGRLLNAVRKLRFDSQFGTVAENQRNRESLTRDVTHKVSGEAELPEEVTLEAPVYKTAGEREPFAIRCAVESDPAEGTLQLLPLPDEIERVGQLALDSIGERLRLGLSVGTPAYQGKP